MAEAAAVGVILPPLGALFVLAPGPQQALFAGFPGAASAAVAVPPVTGAAEGENSLAARTGPNWQPDPAASTPPFIVDKAKGP